MVQISLLKLDLWLACPKLSLILRETNLLQYYKITILQNMLIGLIGYSRKQQQMVMHLLYYHAFEIL